MTTTAATFPTAGANNAGVGTLDWGNPERITADDLAVASVTIAEGGGVSKYLYASTFGFAIPTGATIDGITVVVGARTQSGSQVTASDSSVRLFIAGSPAGDNKAAVGNYPITTPEDVTYGGAADTWGLTPTAEQINATGFGVGFSFTSTAGPQGGSVDVDYITITVTYTAAAGGGAASQTVVMGRWVNGDRRKYNRLVVR
jgi:hypothetical protein